MSKRGVGTNGNNHQSFEQPFPEISAIELITEFIKVELGFPRWAGSVCGQVGVVSQGREKSFSCSSADGWL